MKLAKNAAKTTAMKAMKAMKKPMKASKTKESSKQAMKAMKATETSKTKGANQTKVSKKPNAKLGSRPSGPPSPRDHPCTTWQLDLAPPLEPDEPVCQMWWPMGGVSGQGTGASERPDGHECHVLPSTCATPRWLKRVKSRENA